MGAQESQRLRDPVYGLIVFGGGPDPHVRETDRIAWQLINTREFQRLRRIRQLGFSDFVFPGATHSRFAHCVGAYHTARGIMDVIHRRLGTDFEPNRARVALLAALLHDVGHGPFSHVFENVGKELGLFKHHEDWGREIIAGETEVNGILQGVCEQLPEEVAAMLQEDEPKDIYATVVSSQLDADRLDYLERDRLMTGVQFGHVDRDWLFDCMEVGEVTLEKTVDGRANDAPQQCLYLNHKGIQVGEEYLEARLRMYTMVYMHKTTRAAEKMLGELLRIAAQCDEPLLLDPLKSYFASSASASTSLSLYLGLDDHAVWATLSSLQSSANTSVRTLAQRIFNRDLYKCFDLGPLPSRGNVHLQFRRRVKERFGEREFLEDDNTVHLYRGYDFDEQGLKKVLVKPRSATDEPKDIVDVSKTIQALRDETRSFRLYAPDETKFPELKDILKGVKQ